MDTQQIDVRQLAVTAEARALCSLSHIDYEDAFLVEVTAAQQWTAVDWVKAMLEDAPLGVRTKLILGWLALGLKPAMPISRETVLGWHVRTSTPDSVLLGRMSVMGMPGELLFKRERAGLLFATFVRQDNRIARAVWAATEPQHVTIVRDLLEHAARRLTA
jgi:hypothetical protein